MATSISVSHSIGALDADQPNVLGMVLSAALPLAVFVIANGFAQLNGQLPLFFSPMSLPGWLGAALHLGALPLFGIARWMVARQGSEGRRAGWWVVALMGGLIGFPFLVAPLDSLMLSLVSLSLLVIGLGAMVRVAQVDRRAALLMVPGMAWIGFGALVGLSFAAAWSPPFAVTNSQAGA